MIEWLAGQWQAVVGAVGLAGLIGAWLRGWLLWLVPVSYPQAGRFLRFRWIELFRWPVVAKQDGRFLALVCCLDGDDAADLNTRIVSRALRTEKSLQVVLDWRRVTVGDAADQTEAELRARRRAVEIGAQYRADVVVWGEVAKSGEGLRLHFQAAGAIVTRDVTVSKGFLDAAHREPLNSLLGLVAAAAALSEIASLTDTGQFVADRLRPLADRLKRALDDPALALDSRQRAELQFSLGLALAQIGDQHGDKTALQEAAAVLREALSEYTFERAPLRWAMTQNIIGIALLNLGKRGDNAALHGAVTAYREAQKVYTRERAPLHRAITQNNLGNAFRILGERGDLEALSEAIAAYQEALSEYTSEHPPLYRAMTQNNLASVLLRLGESGDDTALLDAVAVSRQALDESLREPRGLVWAATQNNLGSALLRLGERGDGAALCDAVRAFRRALTEYRQESLPLNWAAVQNNVALALSLQAKRNRDCALITEALTAIDGAINEYAKRDSPAYLEMARRTRDSILATARELGCP